MGDASFLAQHTCWNTFYRSLLWGADGEKQTRQTRKPLIIMCWTRKGWKKPLLWKTGANEKFSSVERLESFCCEYLLLWLLEYQLVNAGFFIQFKISKEFLVQILNLSRKESLYKTTILTKRLLQPKLVPYCQKFEYQISSQKKFYITLIKKWLREQWELSIQSDFAEKNFLCRL